MFLGVHMPKCETPHSLMQEHLYISSSKTRQESWNDLNKNDVAYSFTFTIQAFRLRICANKCIYSFQVT